MAAGRQLHVESHNEECPRLSLVQILETDSSRASDVDGLSE